MFERSSHILTWNPARVAGIPRSPGHSRARAAGEKPAGPPIIAELAERLATVNPEAIDEAVVNGLHVSQTPCTWI